MESNSMAKEFAVAKHAAHLSMMDLTTWALTTLKNSGNEQDITFAATTEGIARSTSDVLQRLFVKMGSGSELQVDALAHQMCEIIGGLKLGVKKLHDLKSISSSVSAQELAFLKAALDATKQEVTTILSKAFPTLRIPNFELDTVDIYIFVLDVLRRGLMVVVKVLNKCKTLGLKHIHLIDIQFFLQMIIGFVLTIRSAKHIGLWAPITCIALIGTSFEHVMQSVSGRSTGENPSSSSQPDSVPGSWDKESQFDTSFVKVYNDAVVLSASDGSNRNMHAIDVRSIPARATNALKVAAKATRSLADLVKNGAKNSSHQFVHGTVSVFVFFLKLLASGKLNVAFGLGNVQVSLTDLNNVIVALENTWHPGRDFMTHSGLLFNAGFLGSDHGNRDDQQQDSAQCGSVKRMIASSSLVIKTNHMSSEVLVDGLASLKCLNLACAQENITQFDRFMSVIAGCTRMACSGESSATFPSVFGNYDGAGMTVTVDDVDKYLIVNSTTRSSIMYHVTMENGTQRTLCRVVAVFVEHGVCHLITSCAGLSCRLESLMTGTTLSVSSTNVRNINVCVELSTVVETGAVIGLIVPVETTSKLCNQNHWLKVPSDLPPEILSSIKRAKKGVRIFIPQTDLENNKQDSQVVAAHSQMFQCLTTKKQMQSESLTVAIDHCGCSEKSQKNMEIIPPIDLVHTVVFLATSLSPSSFSDRKTKVSGAYSHSQLLQEMVGEISLSH